MRCSIGRCRPVVFARGVGRGRRAPRGVGVQEDKVFQTKGQIALDLVRKASAGG